MNDWEDILSFSRGATRLDDTLAIVARNNLNTVAAPSIAISGRVVTMACATTGATIYYTTDGSTPVVGAEGTSVYSAAITLTASAQVKAKAVKLNMNDSPVSVLNCTFTILETPVITYVQNKVVISSVLPGAQIYYTTDGSVPTVSSTAYTGPFTLSGTSTVKAIAVLISAVASKLIEMDTVATPRISVNGATSKVQMLCDTAGVTIYFTRNGSAPTRQSETYTAELEQTIGSLTYKAFAVKEGLTDSTVSEVTITKVAGPRITFNNNSNQVTITSNTMGSKLYYWKSGQSKSDATEIEDGGSFEQTTATTIFAYAKKDGCIDSDTASCAVQLKVSQPTISIDFGIVSMACATDGATIYYTTDGTTPTTGSTVYDASNKPAFDNETVTIKAFAVKSGYTDSDVYSWGVNVSLKPTITVAARICTITAASGAIIEYSTDGGTTFNTYSAAFDVTDSMTVIAYATESLKAISQKVTYSYTYVIQTPVITVLEGALSITCADTDRGAIIYYTTNGTTPTSSSQRWTGDYSSVDDLTTVKVIACKSGWTDSAVQTLQVRRCQAPYIQFTSSGVTMTTPGAPAAMTDAVIRYTGDGSTEPTHSTGTVYSSALIITASVTFKAITTKNGWIDSTVTTTTLSPSTCAQPVITFNNSNNNVTITCGTVGATIYYTTDGSTPTSSSTEYSAAFTISAATTVKAVAMKSEFYDSSVATLSITKAATPSISFNSSTNMVTIDDNN